MNCSGALILVGVEIVHDDCCVNAAGNWFRTNCCSVWPGRVQSMPEEDPREIIFMMWIVDGFMVSGMIIAPWRLAEA